MKAELNYYAPNNKDIVTDTGFRYLDVSSVLKSTKIINGDTDIELFEQFYELNNKLRYCNGSYYKFVSDDLTEKYNQWLKSDDYKKKSFKLYYGNGIVD